MGLAMKSWMKGVDWLESEIAQYAPFDLWMVMTFQHAQTPAVARRCFSCFFKHLNTPREVFFKKLVEGYVVLERHRQSEGTHVHVLLRGISPLLAPRLAERMKKHYCHRDRCSQKWWPTRCRKQIFADPCKKCPNLTAVGSFCQDCPYLKIIGTELEVEPVCLQPLLDT